MSVTFHKNFTWGTKIIFNWKFLFSSRFFCCFSVVIMSHFTFHLKLEQLDRRGNFSNQFFNSWNDDTLHLVSVRRHFNLFWVVSRFPFRSTNKLQTRKWEFNFTHDIFRHFPSTKWCSFTLNEMKSRKLK